MRYPVCRLVNGQRCCSRLNRPHDLPKVTNASRSCCSFTSGGNPATYTVERFEDPATGAPSILSGVTVGNDRYCVDVEWKDKEFETRYRLCWVAIILRNDPFLACAQSEPPFAPLPLASALLITWWSLASWRHCMRRFLAAMIQRLENHEGDCGSPSPSRSISPVAAASFAGLPHEILEEIFLYLDHNDRLVVPQVSHRAKD